MADQIPALRVAHLANYLRDLVRDVNAQGKIAKIEGDPVQVAAVAILSGSIAVVQTMVADIKALAGHAKTQAQPMVRPALESAAARGVGLLFDKLFAGKQR